MRAGRVVCSVANKKGAASCYGLSETSLVRISSHPSRHTSPDQRQIGTGLVKRTPVATPYRWRYRSPYQLKIRRYLRTGSQSPHWGQFGGVAGVPH